MSTVSSNSLGVEITLTDNSPEVKAALKNAIARALRDIGEEAETNAKQVIIQEQRVHTGRMFNSIAHREGEDFTAVGTDVEYAIYQELGTSRGISPARFLTRAATEHTEKYKEIVKESLENA